MNLQGVDRNELVKVVTKLVVEKLGGEVELDPDRQIKIGVSNHHIHLDRPTMDALFGVGSELHPMKLLGQPGQYASAETVTVTGPRGSLKRLRILGPLRAKTQVEISATDGRTIGINPPVRESGHHEGTPGCKISGPKGEIEIKDGVIVALRHIHMHDDDAKRFGVTNGEIVRVKVPGPRGGIMDNVVVRSSPKYALEMHIDTDEGNAFGLKTGDFVELLKSGEKA